MSFPRPAMAALPALPAFLCAAVLALACNEPWGAQDPKTPEAEGAEAGTASGCPSPKSASSDGVLYGRLTRHPWCSVSFLGADERAPRGRLELQAGGRAVFHAGDAVANDAGGPAWAATPERPRSGCWRLEGKELQGSDDGQAFSAVPYELSDTDPPTLHLRGAILGPCP